MTDLVLAPQIPAVSLVLQQVTADPPAQLSAQVPAVSIQAVQDPVALAMMAVYQGPKGESGAGQSFGIAFGDVADRAVFTMPRPGLVQSVCLNITTAWDGAGAALAVKAGAIDLMPAAGNDPGMVAVFEWTPAVHLAADAQIRMLNTAGAGATQGAGLLVLDIVFD
jgi:hypothetical protein